VVWVLGSLAFKIAIGERGRRCNRYEADLFRDSNDDRRAMLCPVIWCDPIGLVLIAQAARSLTDAEYSYLMENDAFPDWDYIPSRDRDGHPFEFKQSDWGSLNGRVVAVDYSAPVLFPPDPAQNQ
jgi:hypothetical protein